MTEPARGSSPPAIGGEAAPGTPPPVPLPPSAAPAGAGAAGAGAGPVSGVVAPAVGGPEPVAQSRHQRVLGALKRTLLHRSEPEAEPEPPPPPDSAEQSPQFSIARMNPFAIGFFGALGAMVAFTLVTIIGQIQSILVLVVLSLFLALGLNPMVDMLRRQGLRRGLSVVIVALSVLTTIVLVAWAIVPVFSEQITNLIGSAPTLLTQLGDNPQIAELDRRYGIIERTREFFASQSLINTVFGGLLGAGRLLANVVFSVIVTLVLTFYFLASLPAIKETVYRLAPRSRRPRVKYLADEMFRRIGGYLSGMFLVVTTAGTCAFIFMLIVGMAKYALALAAMVALFAFIPLVGSNLSMILVALVAFPTVGPVAGFAAIAYFLIYQQFEAYVIQPRVMKRQVDVPAPIVIVVALAGGTLLGIVGALTAIPTAAALLLLYREVLLPRLDRG